MDDKFVVFDVEENEKIGKALETTVKTMSKTMKKIHSHTHTITKKLEELCEKVNKIEITVDTLKCEIHTIFEQKLIEEDSRVLNRAIRTYATGSKPVHFVPARTNAMLTE